MPFSQYTKWRLPAWLRRMVPALRPRRLAWRPNLGYENTSAFMKEWKTLSEEDKKDLKLYAQAEIALA